MPRPGRIDNQRALALGFVADKRFDDIIERFRQDDMEEVMTSLPTPIIGLIVAVFVLVWLVLRTRVHALIAMLAAACIAGLLGNGH